MQTREDAFNFAACPEVHPACRAAALKLHATESERRGAVISLKGAVEAPDLYDTTVKNETVYMRSPRRFLLSLSRRVR